MRKSTPFILALIGSFILPATGATLARYQFVGNYNNNLTLPTGISSASTINFAAGLTEALPQPNTATGIGISGFPAETLYIRSSALNISTLPGATERTISTAIAAGDYFSFELTIAPGYALNLNNVIATMSSSTAVPTDSYISNLAVFYTPAGVAFTSESTAVKLGEQSSSSTTLTPYTFSDNLSGNEALTGTVQFHFVFWDPAKTNLDNRVTRLDDILLDGTLTAVPEPSALLFSSFLLLIPALRRRR